MHLLAASVPIVTSLPSKMDPHSQCESKCCKFQVSQSQKLACLSHTHFPFQPIFEPFFSTRAFTILIFHYRFASTYVSSKYAFRIVDCILMVQLVPRFKRDEVELLQEMSAAVEWNLLNSDRSNIADSSMSHELGILLDQF